MRSRPFAWSAGLAAAVLTAAAPAHAATKTVTMTDALQFAPATVTVAVGDTVVWKNTSVLTHTVTDVPKLAIKKEDVALPQDAKPFNSGYIDPGKTYSHTFTVPGTYRYFCIPHEAAGMVATVVVVASD